MQIKYFCKIFCYHKSYLAYFFSSKYDVDYSFWCRNPRLLLLASVLHTGFLHFLVEEFNEISLFEKTVYFILKDSRVSSLMTMTVMELATKFLTPLTWICSHLFWPPYFYSHIFDHHHQLRCITIEVVIRKLWLEVVITDF